MQVTIFTFRIRTPLFVAKQQIFMIYIPWVRQRKLNWNIDLQGVICKKREKDLSVKQNIKTHKNKNIVESQENWKIEFGMWFYNLK